VARSQEFRVNEFSREHQLYHAAAIHDNEIKKL